MTNSLVRVREVTKEYAARRGRGRGPSGTVHAVGGVSLDIHRGETLGLVGESGCGKTTLGRMLVRLLEPTSGTIEFDGRDITHLHGRDLKWFRRRVQIVFQDPFASLDPRAKVGESMAESLLHHNVDEKDERQERVAKMLEMVGLHRSHASRYPHEFSGGQRQRIGIGRSLILNPDFVVADEPISSLDVSIQAQILNLLRELQRELDLTLLFVAHNLGVVEHISDRVAVMYLGRIVEISDRDRVFGNPSHPYTEALLSAVPSIDQAEGKKRRVVTGEIPSPLNPPTGCTFHPRCPLFEEQLCDVEMPFLVQLPGSAGHEVACHVRTRIHP